MTRTRWRNVLVAAAMPALAAVLPGCKDQLAAPTQGFLLVSTGDVPGVEVFVDGSSRGTASRIGPLDAGTYTVSVAKQGYGALPGDVDVSIPAGGTATASFEMELLDWGQIRVTSTDEILGTEVVGAEILLDVGGGLEATGRVTPAVVDTVPLGAASVVLRRAGFADSEPFSVTVDRFQFADAEIALAPPRAILAEMFTYTICGGCPESAHELDLMRLADPFRIFIVEWHRLGPGWPLFHPASLEREAYYGTGGAAPAVIFQGGTLDAVPVLVGSEQAELAEYHVRAANYLAVCGNDCPVAIKVLSEVSATHAHADVRVLYRGGALPAGLQVQIALLENNVPRSHVGGNQEHFSYVLRDVATLPALLTVPGEVTRFEQQFTINHSDGWSYDWLPGAYNPPDGLRLVAWVQSDVTREILAVGGD